MSKVFFTRADALYRQCKICKCYCSDYDLLYSPIACTCIDCTKKGGISGSN